MGSYFGVEGVEGGLEVLSELVECLFQIGNGSVSHFVIPDFSIGGSSSSIHLVQGGHDLGRVRGVKC